MQKQRAMESITVESIPIVIGREEDGRWWADIESMPGVMAYQLADGTRVEAGQIQDLLKRYRCL
jgi:hypothetical protein